MSTDGTNRVTYAKGFFDLQLQFAHKVAALSRLPLARVLLEYTNFYIRFGLGRDFDPAHPAWQEYLAGLQDTNDIGEWTYSFYSRRPDAMAAPAVMATFAELTALFEHVKRTPRQPQQVIGASWLYNLDAYRRLFPSSYLTTARVIGHRFQHMPLWGQFVDRHGAIKENMTRQFRERLDRQSSLDSLEQCFPFQALSVGAPVQDFYNFYGV